MTDNGNMGQNSPMGQNAPGEFGLKPADLAFLVAAMLKAAGGKVVIPKWVLAEGGKLLETRFSISKNPAMGDWLLQVEEKPPLVVVPPMNPRIR